MTYKLARVQKVIVRDICVSCSVFEIGKSFKITTSQCFDSVFGYLEPLLRHLRRKRVENQEPCGMSELLSSRTMIVPRTTVTITGLIK